MTETVRYRQWSWREIEIAATFWQQFITDVYGEGDAPLAAKLKAFHHIADKLKRNFTGVRERFRAHGPSFNAGGIATQNVAAQAAAERDGRAKAGYRRDLTAQICGDPPPGYSALDRRQQGARR